jgi:hypothetical protein
MTNFNPIATRLLLVCATWCSSLTAAHAQHGVMHLPPIGETRDCALLKPAPNMGHSNRSCEQTINTYLQGHLRGTFLSSQCPADKPLRGLTNISCTDRYNARGELGAAYYSTLCCGYARTAPSYLPAPGAPLSSTLPPPTPAKVIHNLPVSGPGNLRCPPLGLWLERPAAMRAYPYVRSIAGSVDKQCRQAPYLSPLGFARVHFHSCSEDPRGLQYGLITRGDYRCYP